MAIFAIGDLHMSTAVPKPMDKFGWINHVERILNDWKENVTEDDIVLIVGDTSWALKLEDAAQDLEILSEMPGQKMIIRGNHDYWWNGVKKMQKMFPKLYFVHNNHICIKEYIIYGTRGWICPNEKQFSDIDRKIYDREVKRLLYSINSSTEEEKEGKTSILMLHYPPTNEQGEASEFTEIIDRFSIHQVCYGHLHGRESHATGLQGMRNKTYYHLVSCDYLNFKIKKIIE